MVLEGIWTGELYGPYGWENGGVYVLENGRMMGGNHRHYSTGRYHLAGNSFKADIKVHYYGPVRAIFGEQQEDFSIVMTGRLTDDLIDGEICRDDKPDFPVKYRLTRRIDIPDC